MFLGLISLLVQFCMIGIGIQADASNSVGLSVKGNGKFHSQPKIYRNYVENSRDFWVKVCDGAEGKLAEIPVFSLSKTNYTYSTIRQSLTNSKFACPNGAEPSLEITESYPVHPELPLYLSDTEELFEIFRNETVILENGYLSKGTDWNVAWYFSPEEYCLQDVSYNSAGEAVAHLRTCELEKNRPIFPKCCPLGFVLDEDFNCTSMTTNGTLKRIKYLDGKTRKLKEFIEVNPIFKWSDVEISDPCGRETWDMDGCETEFHPVTDNRGVFVSLSRKLEFIESNVPKCFETEVSGESSVFVMRHCTRLRQSAANDAASSGKDVSFAYMICMYFASIFSLITTVVYLLTWKRQNLHGKTLCACTTAMFFMQIFLGTTHLLGMSETNKMTRICKANAMLAQYFMIARFTWLLVLNFDLWVTFSSIVVTHQSRSRYVYYSIFGWGLPLLVSIVSISLNEIFPCKTSGVLSPEFGKTGCFVATWAQGYFVYYILSVLISICCVLMVMTVYALYDFSKSAGQARSTRKSADKQTFLLYLKLSVVMGFTWIFEVISWATSDDSDESSVVWIIFDVYNFLSSILIFIIFVCKHNTWVLLEEAIPKLKGISGIRKKIFSPSTSGSHQTGDSSLEVATLSTNASAGKYGTVSDTNINLL